jgi:phage protein U
MFAQLGSIVFELLNGFNTFDDVTDTKYATHDRIENKPRLQRTGEGLITINFSLGLNMAFCNPTERYNELNDARIAGEVLPLIWGDGTNKGNFVIVSLRQSLTQCDKDGFVMQSKVECTLNEYPLEDKLQTQATQKKAAAPARNTQGGGAVVPPFAGNPSVNLTSEVGQAERDFSYVETAANDYEAGFIDEARLEAQTIESTNKMQNSMDKIEDIYNTSTTIQGKAADLLVYVQDVRDAISTLVSLFPITSFSEFKTQLVVTRTGLRSVRSGSVGVAALSAGRLYSIN